MNLKEIRTSFGWSQTKLAEKMGVARSTIAMWETKGSQPDNDNLLKLSEIFGVSIDYLLGKIDENDIIYQAAEEKVYFDKFRELTIEEKKSLLLNKQPHQKGIRIPVLGSVAAGIPIEAIEDILDYEEISEDMARRGQYFGLKIKGSSMEPRIKEGDVVIVRKQPEVESGDVAIVLVNGDSATCKKVVINEGGLTLIPVNPTYEPQFYSADQVANLPVRIIGKVVELRGKF